MKPRGVGSRPARPESLMEKIQCQLEKDAARLNEPQRRIGELFSEINKRNGLQGLAHLANCLFFAISRLHDATTARQIFHHSGRVPKRLTAALRNAGLLDELYAMKPEPNIAKFARERAKRNEKLPKEQQRGAGGTKASNLEDHIRDVITATEAFNKKHHPNMPTRAARFKRRP